MRPRREFGRKEGNQLGWSSGGRGRNRTNDCRHPSIRKTRNQK